MSCALESEVWQRVDDETDNAHLRDCPDCQLRLAELKILGKMLRELRPAVAQVRHKARPTSNTGPAWWNPAQ